MLVSGTTFVYGIVGNPVTHSLSPKMHNAAFKKLGLDSIYVAFPTSSATCVVDAMRCLGIRGLSVTAPFKEEVMHFLDEVDEAGKEIGAVNTLKLEEGKVVGINTDWIGVVRALEKKIDLEGKRCVVLGAGGTARAALYGLKKKSAHVTVLNRSPDKARKLAGEFGAEFGSLNDLEDARGEILINTTPVGMEPAREESLVLPEFLESVQVVMDVIYKPRKTKLLKDAEGKGCRIVEGLEMLLEQGIAQFEWWTGKKAPRECMATAIGLS